MDETRLPERDTELGPEHDAGREAYGTSALHPGASAEPPRPDPSRIQVGSSERVAKATDPDGERIPARDGWLPPVSLTSRHVPEFPLDTLPTPLMDFARDLAHATQTPPDLAALFAIAACAVAIEKKAEVEIRRGWREQLSVNFLAILAPGSRKTAVYKAIVAPLLDYEEEDARTKDRAIKEAIQARRILELKYRQAIRAMTSGPVVELEAAQRSTEECRITLENFKQPIATKLLADDVSGAALLDLLVRHGGRMGVVSDEATIITNLLSGSRSGAGYLLNLVLKGHCGTEIRHGRKNETERLIRAPALSIAVMGQRSMLDLLAAATYLRDRGFHARFAYCVPVSTVGHRAIGASWVRPEVELRYHETVRALVAFPEERDHRGEIVSRTLPVTPEADALLRSFEVEIEGRLGEDGDLAAMADWAGKLAGLTARIAAILHLALSAQFFGDYVLAVDAAAMASAIRIARYLTCHALVAFDLMGADPRAEDARLVLRWIQRAGKRSFSKRDCFEATKGRFKRVPHLDSALRLLVSHGHIRLNAPEPRIGSGRPRSDVYDVNPWIWSAPPAGQGSEDCANSATTGVSPDVAERPSEGGRK